MKKLSVTLILLFSVSVCFSQAGMWIWLKGDNSSSSPGVYGTQGVPAAANKPPGLYEAAPWTDLNGNFWLFGGSYLPSSSSQSGDLWKYDPVTNQWTWMKGSGMPDDPGSYGTIGVPALSNYPPSRGYGAATWVASNGDLWLFGGGSFNDLWRYNISSNTWTWMHGSQLPGTPGVYGTQGIPSTLNTPGARSECGATWTDATGDLWLFGGTFIDAFNDLWRYHIATDEWTWMKGSNLTNQTGVYGTLGVPNSNNVPGARWVYCSWMNTSGKFLVFGGVSSTPLFERYNDMWRYDPLTNDWTWISGSNLPNLSGTYGALCSSSVINEPAARFENRARWMDACGKLWMYGGGSPNGYLQDLWTFDEPSLEWNLIDGSSISNMPPVFGTIGVPDPSNTPGCRNGALSWRSNNGEFYLFGGYVTSSGFGVDCRNDVWKFVIDTSCSGGCSTTGMMEAGNNNQIFAAPNPCNATFVLSFEVLYPQTIELRMFNALSSSLYFSKQDVLPGKFSKKINVQSLSNGIYFLQIKTKEGVLNKKIIVQH